MPTPTPANALSKPAHDTRSPLTIMVPPPSKRRRGQAVPVPVPNLTKKSRGRSVPTIPNSISAYGVHRTRRSFICAVTDCGKCFARGEHLKRHIRSIHTNEKPFLCSFPGCDKAFSRHDNLGQHMRVHRHQR
ncbi:hypothetical protein BDM02DRAFT_3154064 [Thelephora ganbajun]|uniref:Uncharacterized protein n=1 Tax=Thelephora ganbajun TaxID=370292 RepID=A0ACB6ZRI2_THEGA|nr:hypothetical protein BDM02DRAFT_3154064 [Thelephora ganbajun]